MFDPTPEQGLIFEAAKNTKDNLMIEAYAGCGKTSTLKMTADLMSTVPSMYLVFNKKNQLEAASIFPPNFTVLTANGLGHRAWGKTLSKKLTLNTDKLRDILKSYEKVEYSNFGLIMQVVRKARHSGLIPSGIQYENSSMVEDEWETWENFCFDLFEDLNDEVHFYARKLLVDCIKLSFQGVIDFDDQIYMPALFGGNFPRYPVVMVDEAQDLSSINHIQVKRASAERIIAVGDTRQAIYAFRGADSNSMANLRKLRPQWTDLKLSTTFRCPKLVVERQSKHAIGFNAGPANAEGEVRVLDKWKIEELPRPLAIICRNNAPIIACALRIIARGMGCTVQGGEIGKQLINLSKKVIPTDSAGYEECVRLIELWRRNETIKATAKDQTEKIGIINDRADCLLAVLDNSDARTAAGLRAVLGTMFTRENNQITLSTIHRAKGLEWPTVIHLDPFRLPSKFALKARDAGNPVPLEQEMNLQYVCETRSKNRLYFADLDKMENGDE